MSLSVLNNVSSLTAENAISNTSNNLSNSLQKLSTGLQLNSGADGPAALVISNAQQAQITGLQTAISNSNQAVSLVQTGDGALNEISTLLNQIRGLAVSSANSGVLDQSALAANQNQISNALNTINQISGDTSFNGRNLFDGSAGYDGTASSNSVTFLSATSGAAAGNNAISVRWCCRHYGNFICRRRRPADDARPGRIALAINGVQVSWLIGSEVATVVSAIFGQRCRLQSASPRIHGTPPAICSCTGSVSMEEQPELRRFLHQRRRRCDQHGHRPWIDHLYRHGRCRNDRRQCGNRHRQRVERFGHRGPDRRRHDRHLVRRLHERHGCQATSIS